MGTQRSNTSHRIRKIAGPAIFDCTSSDLATSAKRKELFQQRIGWVEDKGHYTALEVDILHKDYKGRFDLETIFLNPILMRVSMEAFLFPLETDFLLGLRCYYPWSNCCRDAPSWRVSLSQGGNNGVASWIYSNNTWRCSGIVCLGAFLSLLISS